ncbi:MAG: glucokinase [Pseudobdellovibrionaceae bacterium]
MTETPKDAVLLADIGGTHARFGLYHDGLIHDPVLLPVADYADALSCFQAVAETFCVKTPASVAIASSGQVGEDGNWLTHNNDNWLNSKDVLTQGGFNPILLVNDFVATTRGCVKLTSQDYRYIRHGSGIAHMPIAALGPGTGLGLAYAIPMKDKSWHVCDTFGGHMPVATIDDEQALIVRTAQRFRPGAPGYLFYEDLIAGRGLPALYKAISLIHGKNDFNGTAKDILELDSADPIVASMYKHFSSLLGSFTKTAVLALQAYGGVYMDGGLIQKIVDQKKFDLPAFEHALTAPSGFPVIDEKFEKLPVRLIDTAYIALRGLKGFLEDGKHS